LNAAGSGPGFYCGTCTVFVYRGQTLTAATVGLPGTTRSGGRTMLWLADPSGNYVASNWYYQNTYNSYLTWTATSSGTYTIYEGEPAFSQQSSIGNAAGFTNVQATVGWTLTALPMPPPTLPPPPQIQYNQCPQFSYQQALPGQQSPPYITNMNNGVVFANCNFNANAGQVVQFGAAQMPGAQYSGPVVLWLRNSAGTVIMTGSGTGTPMTYTILTSGQYSIWEGCSDWRSSCSATVGAWRGRGGGAVRRPRRRGALTRRPRARSVGVHQHGQHNSAVHHHCVHQPVPGPGRHVPERLQRRLRLPSLLQRRRQQCDRDPGRHVHRHRHIQRRHGLLRAGWRRRLRFPCYSARGQSAPVVRQRQHHQRDGEREHAVHVWRQRRLLQLLQLQRQHGHAGRVHDADADADGLTSAFAVAATPAFAVATPAHRDAYAHAYPDDVQRQHVRPRQVPAVQHFQQRHRELQRVRHRRLHVHAGHHGREWRGVQRRHTDHAPQPNRLYPRL